MERVTGALCDMARRIRGLRSYDRQPPIQTEDDQERTPEEGQGITPEGFYRAVVARDDIRALLERLSQN